MRTSLRVKTVSFSVILGMLLALVPVATRPADAFKYGFTGTPDWETITTGGLTHASNSLLTCTGTGWPCTDQQQGSGTYHNGSLSMGYIDVDGDPSTSNSSSATLTVPAGATVLHAGLYWGARTASYNQTVMGSAKFQTPGGSYQSITADQVFFDSSGPYQSYKDVTAEVAAAGTGSYTLGGIDAATGLYNRYGGWSLVVAYEDPTLPYSQLTIFRGLGEVYGSGGAGALDLTVNGIVVPNTGPRRADIINVVYEGDGAISGDRMLVDGNVVSDGAHPATNFFNSRISRDGSSTTDRNPAYVDNLGFDAALTNIDGLLPAGATSTNARYETQGDQYFVGVVGLAIELQTPIVAANMVKTAVDVNGTPTVEDDVITYSISSTNTGQDLAQNLQMTDVIPAGMTYVPGSLKITSHPGPLGGTSPDDDMANIATDGGGFDGTNVRFNLGTLQIGESFTVSYQTKIDTGVRNTVLTNNVDLTYDGSYVSNLGSSASHDLTVEAIPTADLAVTSKTASPDPVIAGEQLTYTINIANNGPDDVPDAVITDVLPAGLTFVSGPGCSASGQTVTCNVPSPFAANTTGSIAIITNVDPALAPTTLTNTASIASATYRDLVASNDSASVTSATIRSTDLSITKTAAPTTLNAGENVTYTLTVTNAGPSVAASTSVTDVLPGNHTLVSATPSNATTCSGTATITCALGDLDPAEVVTITVVAQLQPSAGEGLPAGDFPLTFTNTASATTITDETTTANNSASANTTTNRFADLAITKTGPATAHAGQTVQYSITVTNNGPSTAQNVEVSDVLPAPLVFNSTLSSPDCASGVSCNVGTLAVGESVILTITADLPQDAVEATTLTNTATVSSPDDPDGATSAAVNTTVTRQVDYVITKIDNVDPVPAGEQITYTVNVNNAGPSQASNVTITDTLDAAITPLAAVFEPAAAGACTISGQAISCVPTGGVLNAGTNAVVKITVQVPAGATAGSTIPNEATVSGTETNAAGQNSASASETTTVINVFNLTVGKVVSPSPVIAGEQITYTITTTNTGPSDAINPQILDVLPADLTLVSAAFTPETDGNCTASGQNITCIPPSINAGETKSITVVATVAPTVSDGTNLVNKVYVTSVDNAGNNLVTSGDAAVLVKREADVTVTKTSSPNPVVAGEQITYEVVVSNAGPSQATSINVFDPLPTSVIDVVVTSPCTLSSGTVSCTHPSLNPGESVTFSFTGVVKPNVQPGTNTITNTASVTIAETDPTPANNSATELTDTTATIALGVTKVDNVDPVIAGQTVIYTIEATNAGPSDADNVQIIDTPPAGLTFDAAASTSGCGLVGANVVCSNIGTLTPGGSAQVNLAFTVDASTPPSVLTNSVNVRSDEDNVGASTTHDTTVTTQADVAISKSGPASAVPGENVTWTLTASNNGPSAAANVVVSDPLPNNVTFSSATPTTCTHDGVNPGGVVTCTFASIESAASETIQITATVEQNATGSLSNSASITTDTTDPEPGNDSVGPIETTLVPQADVSVTKTASATTADAGTGLSYTITVQNAGPSAASTVQITDTLPAPLIFASATGATCSHDGATSGGVVTCTIASLGASETATITINTTIDPATEATSALNNVSVTTTTTDTDTTNQSDTAVTAITKNPSLSMSKTASTSGVAGEAISYTITVSNAGPSSALGVSVNDSLPTEFQYTSFSSPDGISCSHDGALNGGDIACGFGTVGPSESKQVTFEGTISSSASGTFTNTATATNTSQSGSITADATVTATTAADLVLTGKADNIDPATAGGPLQYTVGIRNDGPSDAQAVVLTDVLDAGVSFDATNSDAACTASGQTVTCSQATLATGQSANFVIAVTIDPAQSATLSNNATVSSSTADPNNTNNTLATAETTAINREANLTMTKVAPSGTVNAGEDISYEISVTNPGPSTATNVATVDTFPAETVYQSVSSTGGACVPASPATSMTCSWGTLAVGATVTATVVVKANTSLAVGATVTNTASTSWDESTTPISADATTTIARSTDLSVLKTDQETAANPTVSAGTDAIYTLTANNAGPSDASGVTITDVLPTGMTFNPSASSSNCTAAGQTVTCVIGDVVANPSPAPQVVIAATIAPDVNPGDVLTNTASITGNETDPDSTNNSATETTTVGQTNDLSITKVGSDPSIAGENLQYDITVTNAGPADGSNIVVTDTLPAGLSFVAAGSSTNCTAVGQVVTCNIATLPAGSNTVLTINTAVDPSVVAGSSITNTVEITSHDGTDPTPDNTASVSTTVNRSSGLNLSKTASPAAPTAGENVTYTLVLENAGPSDASGAQIVDALPAELSFVSATVTSGTATCNETGGTVTCDIGADAANTLPAGQSVTVEIVAQVSSAVANGGSISNTATADSNDSAPTSATQDSPVIRSSQLTLAKTVSPSTVSAGETVTYSITVTNEGPSDAANVNVNDALPSSLSRTSGDCAGSTGLITCQLANLTAGASHTFSFVATVDSTVAAGSVLTNNATATSDSPDPDNTAATATSDLSVERSSDLALTKTDGGVTATAGETLSYTLTGTNNGPSQATNVVITDEVPAGTTFNAAASSADCALSGTTITCNIAATLEVGANATAAVVFNVDQDLAAGTTITNTATLAATEPDPNTLNNSATETTPTQTSADISIVKNADSATGVAGSNMTWTVVVTNDGPSQAQNVNVTDTVGPGLSVVSVSSPNCDTTINCNFATIDAGGSETIQITTAVDESQTADVTNTASVTSDTTDPDTNDLTSGPVTVPVSKVSDLAISKTRTPTNTVAGEPITYTIVVTNAGPSAVVGATVQDILPTELLEPASSCTITTGNGTCTNTNGGMEQQFNLDLEAGSEATIEITATVSPEATGSFQNTATVAAPAGTTDPNPDNNSNDDDTPAAPVTRTDLSVTKAVSPNPGVAGEASTYTITVTNAGPSTATSASLSDVLPSALLNPTAPSCTVSGPNDTCSASLTGNVLGATYTLQPASTMTVQISGEIDPSNLSAITNTVNVTPGPGATDPDLANNEATVTHTPTTSADLVIAKRALDPAVAGQTMRWEVTVNNQGPSDAQNVVVTDTIPAELTITSEPAYCTGGVCTIATIADGATETLVFTTEIAPDATDPITNTASVTSDTSDPTPNTPVSSTTDPTSIADLSLSKTSSPQNPIAGEQITYTLTVTNAGPSTALASQLTDTLPAGLLNPTVSCGTSPAGGSCTASITGNSVSATMDIPPGTSQVVTVVATITSEELLTVTNTATVSAGAGVTDPDDTNNNASVTNTAEGQADLSVTKTVSPDPLVPGANATYTITVTNAGPSRAVDARMSDLLPSQLLDPSATCNVAAADGSCSLSLIGDELNATMTLQAGRSLTVEVTGDIDPSTVTRVDNTASVHAGPDAPDPNSADNITTIRTDTAPSADLSVTKTLVGDAVAGQNATWTVTVTNNGPSDAVNVNVADTLPAGMTFVSEPAGCSNGTCYFPRLAPYTDTQLTFVAAIPSSQTGFITNTVAVSSTTPDPDGTGPDASETSVVQTVTDLSITKVSSPSVAIAGETLTYTITIHNQGPSDAVNANVADSIPPQLLNPSATCETSPSGGACNVTMTGNDLAGTVDIPNGQSQQITITGTVDPAQIPRLNNTATVAPGSGATDPNPADNTGIDINPSEGQSDVAITKSSSPTELVAGEPVSYEITVVNNGPTNTTNASVYDVLPNTITAAIASCSVATPSPANVCSASVNDNVMAGSYSLAVGQSATFSIEAIVSPSAVGATITNTATTRPGNTTPDTDMSNNSASVTNTAIGKADLSITKAAAGPAVAGEELVWIITVENAGPSDANNVNVTDTLPTGMTLLSEPAGCNAGSCVISHLAAGANTQLRFVTQLDSTVSNSLTNNATVSSDVEDPDPTNSQTATTIEVTKRTDLRVTKTVSPLKPQPGDTVTYTVTTYNDGPSFASGATVSDPFPLGLEAPNAICGPISGTNTCTVATSATEAVATLDIAVGSSVSFTVSGTVKPDGQNDLENTAISSPGIGAVDPNPVNSQASVDPNASPVDLRVTKTSSPNPAVAGAPLTYTIVISNDGPNDAVGATLTDVLPQGFTPNTPSCDAPAANTCSISINGDTVSATTSIATGTSVTVTIPGVLDTQATGVLRNSATAKPGPNQFDETPSDATSNDINNIIQQADIAITKIANGTAVAGENLALTINVTNNGPSLATNVVIEDVLPPGLTLISAPSICSATRCVLTELAAGTSRSIEIVTKVSSTTSPVQNTATVTSDQTDPNPANNSATSPPVDVSSVTDLSLTKTSSPASVGPDQPVTYVLALTNNGPSPAIGASIIDALGPELILTAASCTPNAIAGVNCNVTTSGNDVTATVDIPSGATVEVVISATTTASYDPATQTLTNTATASVGSGATDPNPADNSATDINNPAGYADLTVTKSVQPLNPTAGEAMSYVIEIANAGPDTSQNASIVDQLPPEFTPSSASCADPAGGSCTVTLNGQQLTGTATIPASTTATVTIEGTLAATAELPVTNRVSVTPDPNTPDPQPSGGSPSVTFTPNRIADLSVIKTAVGDMVAGQENTWEITVVNNGPSSAQNVIVTDATSQDVQFISALPNCAGPRCVIDHLDVSQTATITVKTHVADPGSTTGDQQVTNSAAVSSDTADSDPTNNTNSATATTVQQTDLSVSKTSTPNPAVPGKPIRYELVFRNNGPATANGASFSDELPQGLSNITISCVAVPTAGQCNAALNANTASGTLTIPPGEVAVVHINAVLDSNHTEELTNTATVQAGSGQSDPNPSDNSSTDINNGDGIVDLVVTKTSSPNPATPGMAMSYAISVHNQGPSDAHSATLEDVLPQALLDATASCEITTGTGTCSPLLVGQNLQATFDLSVGSTLTLTVNGDLDPSFTGTLQNTVSTNPGLDATDPNPAGAIDTQTPVPQADLVLTKEPLGTLIPGTSQTWRLVVANNGPSTARNVVVNEQLGAGLTVVQAPGFCNGTSCAVGDISPNSTVTLEFILAIAPDHRGPITNTATVTSDTEDPVDSGPTTVTVDTESGTDLRITKTSSPDPVIAGETVTFTIAVTNEGPSNAYGATMRDELPNTLSAISASCIAGSTSACATTVTGNTVNGELDLVVGETREIKITATLASAALADFSNTASVTPGPGQTDRDPTDNSSTALSDSQGSADVSVSKALTSPVSAGEAISYEITVTNNGPSRSVNTQIRDDLIDELLNPSVSCNVAANSSCDVSLTGRTVSGVVSLDPNEVAVITVNATLDPAAIGDITNAVVTTPSAQTPDPDASNNTGSVTETTTTNADVSVTKQPLGPAVAGRTMSWHVVVTNDGPAVARDVILEEVLPQGLSLVNEPSICSNGVCHLSTIAVGTSVELIFDTLVAADATVELNNELRVSSSTNDPDVDDLNPSVSTGPIGQITDLGITKTSTPSPAVAGEAVRYEITVTNYGPSDATGATMRDVLPTALLSPTVSCVDTNTSSCAARLENGEVITELNIPAGASRTILVEAVIDAASTQAVENTATVTPGAGQTDPNPNNNTALNSNSTDRVADLTLTKVLNTDPLIAGEPVSYNLIVTNNGPSNAVGATLSDVVPNTITDISASCNGAVGCNVDISANTVTATLDVVVGGTVTITVNGRLRANASGNVENNASVQNPPDTTDPNSDGNKAVVVGQTTGRADLETTKRLDGDSLKAGESAQWIVTVVNHGPSTAQDVVVTEVLPTYLSLQSAPVGCSSVSCDIGNLAPNERRELVFTTNIDPEATGNIANTATVTSATQDLFGANNTSVTKPIPVEVVTDWRIEKALLVDGVALTAPATVKAGDTIQWQITATNNGPAAGRGAKIIDVLPAGVENVTLTCNTTGSAQCVTSLTGSAVEATVDANDGEEATVVITATVKAGFEGSLTNNASMVTGPGAVDPTPNEAIVEASSVLQAIDLEITQRLIGPATGLKVGDTVTFEIEVTNHGPAEVTGARVASVLPAQLANAQWTCQAGSGASCQSASGAGALDALVDLTVSAKASFRVTAVIVAPGQFRHVVSVTAPDGVAEVVVENNRAAGELMTVESVPTGKRYADPLPDPGPFKPITPKPVPGDVKPADDARESGPLAHTGSNVGVALAMAAGLILSGGFVVIARRRREE